MPLRLVITYRRCLIHVALLLGSTKNLLDFIVERVDEAVERNQPSGERLSFVLGTEVGKYHLSEQRLHAVRDTTTSAPVFGSIIVAKNVVMLGNMLAASCHPPRRCCEPSCDIV